MKKFIWAFIALIPLSVFGGTAKWIHGHGTDMHHDYFQGTYEDGGRDVASQADADKTYDSEERDDSRDEAFDRGNFTGSGDSADWDNADNEDADRTGPEGDQ